MRKDTGKVTIKSIAEELGVSFSTVAKALNGDPNVSQQTRELVEKKAKEMNYTRNYFAQSLRQKGSKTVAIILNDIDIPAYGEMIAMISSELSAHGYTTMVSDPRHSDEAERSCIKTVLSRMPEAVIFSPADPRGRNLQLLQPMFSNTLVLGELDGNVPTNSLSVGHRRAGFISADHMLQCGHSQNMICCGPREYQSSQLFFQGISDAYRHHGIALNEDLVYWFKPGDRETAQLFARVWEETHGGIDGVICFCDSMAFGVYRAARKLGLRIPEDISVIGYDDTPVNDLMAPPLTTVHLPKDMVAQYCAQFVLSRLASKDSQLHTYQLEPRLADRGSVSKK